MQGQVTITNSTIAGNTAAGGQDSATDSGKGMGGGVFNLSGPVSATGSTLAGNSADFDGTSIFNVVYDSVQVRTASVTLHNTIVGGTGPFDLATDRPANTNFTSNAPGSVASADLADRNLVQTRHTLGTGTITGAPLTTNPLLGPLQANGGPTRTMLPGATSPVVTRTLRRLKIDQRGLSGRWRPPPMPATARTSGRSRSSRPSRRQDLARDRSARRPS